MSSSGNGSSPSGNSGSWWSRMSRSEQVIAAISTAIVAGIFAIIVAVINHSSDSPPTASPHVSSSVVARTSPAVSKSMSAPLNFNKPPNWEKEGKVISVTLTGTVPRGEHLWIFVHHAGNYYVQAPLTSEGPDLWSSSTVNLGSSQASDINSWYTIYAVLANSQANKRIQAEYNNSHELNYGMPTIPGGSGAKKAAYITLYRNH